MGGTAPRPHAPWGAGRVLGRKDGNPGAEPPKRGARGGGGARGRAGSDADSAVVRPEDAQPRPNPPQETSKVPCFRRARLTPPPETKWSGRGRQEGAAQAGRLPSLPLSSTAQAPASFFRDRTRAAPPLGPSPAPRGAPCGPQRRRAEVGGPRLRGPRRALPPRSGMAARRGRACAAAHGAAGLRTGTALAGRTGG